MVGVSCHCNHFVEESVKSSSVVVYKAHNTEKNSLVKGRPKDWTSMKRYRHLDSILLSFYAMTARLRARLTHNDETLESKAASEEDTNGAREFDVCSTRSD